MGVLRGYVQVKAYTNPLAVIDHNGKITYIAFFEHQTAVVDENGAYSDELLGQILSGELVNVKIHVEAAEKGKTVLIDGKRETVWQAHQIDIKR